MDFIDLHVHSTASDGTLSPSEIVQKAMEIGLFAVAITDHDTVNGLPEAIEAAQNCPMAIIPGIELSTHFEGHEIHLLGYCFNYADDQFLDILSRLAELRLQRNAQMCNLLYEQGFDISLNKLQEVYGKSVITRANIAQYLTDCGYTANNQEAFDKYIGDRASCYVPRYKLPLDDAVRLIRLAGGFTSIAHPAKYNMTDDEYESLFKAAKKSGVNCIEVYHSDNTPDDENKFIRLSEKYGFKKTGGTDFHGAIKPTISLGTGKGNIMVPKTFLRNIGIFLN